MGITIKKTGKRGIALVAMLWLFALSCTAFAASKSGNPGKLQEVRVLKVESGKVTLRWSSNAKAAGYQVFVKKADGSYKRIKTLGQDRSSVTISNLKNGKVYFFKVRAYAGSGSGKVFGPFSRTLEGRPVSDKVMKKTTKVHPYYYTARMNQTVKVKGKRIPSGAAITVKRELGTSAQITYRKKSYTVPTTSYTKTDFITRSGKPYSAKEGEAYVNVNGYSSESKYLIWISTYTQHIYVFKGSQYNWKCVKRFICATGKLGGETPIAISQVHAKRPYVWFNEALGQGGYFGFRIRGGYMHSWPYNIKWEWTHGSKLLWSREHYGRPTSAGCIRTNIKNAEWMYKRIPVNTTVVAY